MIHTRKVPFVGAIVSSWKLVVPIGLWASLLTALHDYADWTWLAVPTAPVSILGTAVAFYLGFKGNAAYQRTWEARIIWGGIVNSSRTWGVHCINYVTDRDVAQTTDLHPIHQELIYRHVAWLAALRTLLRRPREWEHGTPRHEEIRRMNKTFDQSDARMRERMTGFLSEQELDWVMARKNQATQLLAKQGERLRELRDQGLIDDFRHVALGRLIEELYALQGKCERIKNFPVPRTYSTANHWFVLIFMTLVPLSMLGTFQKSGVWMAVPASILLCWVFFIWDRVVDYGEHPFQGLANDIPMDALSRTIEIDLREMLGEQDLPPPTGKLGPMTF